MIFPLHNTDDGSGRPQTATASEIGTMRPVGDMSGAGISPFQVENFVRPNEKLRFSPLRTTQSVQYYRKVDAANKGANEIAIRMFRFALPSEMRQSHQMTSSSDLKVPAPTAQHEVRAVDGYPILLRRHGNPYGPRLAMSHGNGFAIDAYWPFWSQFVDGFDVFVFDIRSHGRNPVGPLNKHSIPMLAEDLVRVSHEIDHHFGAKRKVGIFHSLTALAVLHARIGVEEFAALVLFDPPMLLPGREMEELEALGSRMGKATRKRREHFGSLERYVKLLSHMTAFNGLDQAKLELFARASLRPAADGNGFRLACPREHEARMWDALYPFARTVDFAAIKCPVKVIGSDPTVPNSFLPSTVMPELIRLDYDFVPETTHLLQLEEPAECAAFMLDYLAKSAFSAK